MVLILSDLGDSTNMAIMCEINPDIILTSEEKAELQEAFAGIVADPYRHYDAFRHQVGDLIGAGKVPERLIDIFAQHADSSPKHKPFIFARNMPIDDDVPFFDNGRPVYSKYELKKTFYAEASLSLIGHLLNQTPIGYLNVNGGDVFQDIYPDKALCDTQSQKAVGAIYFHKDLANHYVRPDYVNMLALRASEKNSIYTTFVKNVDVMAEFSESELEEFRRVQFYTPFDDLTVKSGRYAVGDADQHPIISGDNDIRYFENRTTGTDARSDELVEKMKRVMHKVKKRVQMCPGDFIGVANNHSVHGKEVGDLGAPEEAWSRWTMKTVNVDSTVRHRTHMVSGSDYLVAG